jgi:F-type H+-transporting ATPase subunit epsilon
MRSQFNITILTPEGAAYESSAYEVVASTKAGEIGILARHTPLLTILEPGRLTIKKEDGTQHFAISGGMLEVRRGGQVIVLADTVERGEEIDFEKATNARKRAEEVLANKESMSKEDFAIFEAELNRDLARVKLGRIFLK